MPRKLKINHYFANKLIAPSAVSMRDSSISCPVVFCLALSERLALFNSVQSHNFLERTTGRGIDFENNEQTMSVKVPDIRTDLQSSDFILDPTGTISG